jgi:hypothetical protein
MNISVITQRLRVPFWIHVSATTLSIFAKKAQQKFICKFYDSNFGLTAAVAAGAGLR